LSASQKRKQTQDSRLTTVLAQTALKAGVASSTPTTIRTRQTMHFKLAGIDVGMSNDAKLASNSGDFFRFVVIEPEANLERSLQGDLPQHKLRLLVADIAWWRYDGPSVMKEEQGPMTAEEVIAIAKRQFGEKVAGIPQWILTMKSTELPDRILEYEFDLEWDSARAADLQVMPYFFDRTSKSFTAVINGLNEAENGRSGTYWKRQDTAKKAALPSMTQHEASTDPDVLKFHRVGSRSSAPIPRFAPFGRGQDVARNLVPALNDMVEKHLPEQSHRFVTVQLENGMDMLLNLYERLLPKSAASLAGDAS